ncbi:MAG: carbon storage regulator CsrA [Syntrophomonadaceae bacterium]|jgi:carbon storage regulator|nr:carbon storage regulator CsrA [Syntrophomonadaceae bacterium]
MLVLNRKKGESIIISDDIEISVLEVQGEYVKLGIAAPKTIEIFRKEVYEEIIAVNRESSKNLNLLKEQLNAVQEFSKEVKKTKGK